MANLSIRDLLPPIALAALRRWRQGQGVTTFASYGDALQSCVDSGTESGYENSDLVRLIVAKTERYRADLATAGAPIQLGATAAYSLAALLTSGDRDPIQVIDFGGAAGAHYLLARALLPESRRLRWIVVETPAMVRQAEPALSSDELAFSADLQAAVRELGRVDLLHTSGTLQCVANPYATLDSLLATGAHHILFNRLGWTAGPREVITTHASWLSDNGPGAMPAGFVDRRIRYPFVFPRQDLFQASLARHYEILLRFEDASGVFPVGREPLLGLGLLARRKA